jgi:hypothetical protein
MYCIESSRYAIYSQLDQVSLWPARSMGSRSPSSKAFPSSSIWHLLAKAYSPSCMEIYLSTPLARVWRIIRVQWRVWVCPNDRLHGGCHIVLPVLNEILDLQGISTLYRTRKGTRLYSYYLIETWMLPFIFFRLSHFCARCTTNQSDFS